MKSPMLQGPDRIVYVTKDDVVYRCVRIGSFFKMGNRGYPAGSWLVQGPSDEYQTPLTVEEFQAWREVAA